MTNTDKTNTDKTKRSFFKKAAAAVGFIAAANYLGKFIVTRSNSIHAINDNSVNDVNKQKTAWLQKQFTPMTDNDKKQMLDKILDSHNKNRA
jgi:hypothetical protein